MRCRRPRFPQAFVEESYKDPRLNSRSGGDRVPFAHHWIEVLTLVLADAWSRENVPVAIIVDPDKKRDVTLAWQGGAQVCLTRPPKPEELIQFVKRVAQTWPQRD